MDEVGDRSRCERQLVGVRGHSPGSVRTSSVGVAGTAALELRRRHEGRSRGDGRVREHGSLRVAAGTHELLNVWAVESRGIQEACNALASADRVHAWRGARR
jgi:hypothetical protein